MKKLYLVNISIDTDIIVAAESEFRAIADTKGAYAISVINGLSQANIFVTANEIKNKKYLKDEMNNMPYGDDDKTIGEIWKEMEKYRKEQAHKEWLEKYHMTFDFYKDAKNG
jgi:hypothetical protein